MSFISRAWTRLGGFDAPLQPRIFANPNFVRIPADVQVEEEGLPDYLPARYYPMRIGEVLVGRYQVVGKLGFGRSSTVWLARDLLRQRRHVALKVFIRSQALGDGVGNEIAMFKRMEQRKSSHPGRSAVRTLLDSFHLDGPEGEHLVLAHPPLWRSIEAAIRCTSPRRLPASGLRYVLKDLFLALEYLHDGCQIIHTDIKADNIMFSIKDSSVFTEFEEEEMNNPCPRKEAYRRRAHLAEITVLLGPPPKDLLTRGRLASKFFSEQGTYAAGIDLPTSTSLEEQETLLTGDDKKKFLEFMRKMLQWSPERRSTARELFQDAWLQERS
ncbi:hypothetical protein MY4038_004515 [Beauveria bassiana]